MTPFFSLEMTESDLIQRTPHVHVQSESCAHTSAVKSTVLQVYSAPKSTRRRFRSIAPATTSTHVPSRAMCRVAPIPRVICFCTHHCEYSLTTRSAHVATRVISHEPAESEGQPHRPSLSLHRNHYAFRCPVHGWSQTDSNQYQMRVHELPQILFHIKKGKGKETKRKMENEKGETVPTRVKKSERRWKKRWKNRWKTRV